MMVATETGTFVLLLSRLNCFLLTPWEMKANWSVGKRTWEFPLVVLLRSENSATASLSFWFHSLLSTLSLKWGKISISFDKNDQNIQLFVVASLKKKKKMLHLQSNLSKYSAEWPVTCPWKMSIVKNRKLSWTPLQKSYNSIILCFT